MKVPALRYGRALLCAAFVATITHHTLAQAPNCPCTIWAPNAVPTNAAVTDNRPIEVGVKFRSDVAGFVTAIRFYKGPQNTGTHIGHLWSAAGALLAQGTFTNETASGWQELQLSPPVAISAQTTYVASYFSDGFFAIDSAYFAATGVDTPPLHALQAGIDGPNGVFRYDTSGFPSSAGNSSNYWVDVVFHTDLGPDVTPPSVSSVAPASGATGVALSSTVRANFSEAIDVTTISASTFDVRDANGAQLSGTIAYDAATRSATFTTTAGLLPETVYTATVRGGAEGVHDLAGNAMASDFIWSFTTGNPTPPGDEGPGGPILVVSSPSNPFSRYYAEILRTEGLNEFTVRDISLLTPPSLGAYDVVLLGEIPLTSAQVAMFGAYVSAGGNLVAMRPDKQLATLLGLSDQSATLANAYLKIDTTSQPGAGIVSETIQFHGTADRYVVDDAITVATLYGDADTATTNPAVTIRSAGANGGHAAAFTFDLARSVVYTRQGNPAWSGRERDNDPTPGGPFIRSNDLFFGAAPGDVQPDWVNLDKVAIPQADEQQRLLANLVQYLNRLRKPLPRFWYLPRGLKAAIVMTGDDHRNGGTVGRFNQFKQLSPANCSVVDWECIRGTSYIFTNTPGMDDAASLAFVNEGFEVALHVTANSGQCGNWTPASLANSYSTELAAFRSALPSVPAPQTNRTHCIVWTDYVSQPKVELANGIRLDTNYYYFPNYWVQNRPGVFTGSAMPMRFADLDGTTIDVYQAATQLTDESGQAYPFHTDTLLDRALGPLGYYGVFTTNHHTDQAFQHEATSTVQSAIARGVPVVSAKQMLDWLDGRNASSFGSIGWNQGVLTFTVTAGATAHGLTAMVPAQAQGGALLGITRDGAAVTFQASVVKGVHYALFSAAPGSYAATYAVDDTSPVISDVAATPGLGTTAVITWTTNEPADSRVDFGTSPTTLTSHVSNNTLVTSHNVTLTGLTPLTTYYYRVVSADGGGDSTTSAVFSLTMPSTVFSASDTTVADFSAGTPDAQTAIAQTADGEVALAPAAGSEFFGTTLPAEWSTLVWAPPNGGATVANGVLTVDGARTGTTAFYPAGRSLEFVATFGGAPFQHVGFSDTFDDAPFAMFSTWSGGLFARTASSSGSQNTMLPSSLVGTPHRFRIDWTATATTYLVDGTVVATHPVAFSVPLRPLVSDFTFGGNSVTVDWMRMSPYASAATFLSRVFDGNTAVNWGSLSWTAQAPAGTSVAFAARRGDTPVPDATWTAFAPISSSGGAIGGSSRYLQYRVDLATANPDASPSVESVTIGYSEIPPNHVPVTVDDSFSGLHAPLAVEAPGVLANDGDADGDPITAILVSGPAHGTVVLQPNGAFTFTPAAGFSGTDAFTYIANDGRADSNVGVVSISIAATPLTATDTSVADFGAGAPDAHAYLAQTGDGDVILRPTAGSELSGTTLPGDWNTAAWNPSGAVTLSGGMLTADGAWAGTAATYPAGRSLEFVATFTGAPYQHVGFGDQFNTAPWAIVSTGTGGGLFARTWSGGTPLATPLPGDLLGSPHRFRIDWTATGVVYSVDGVVVVTEAIVIAEPMRPLISDFTPNDGALSVDWIRMSPYASAATYLSRVVDASTFANWGALSWTAQVPPGTTVAFSARHGESAVPDETWTAFATIPASGSAIGGSSRYVQYRIDLASSNPDTTPIVEQVSIAYSRFTANQVPVAADDSFGGERDLPLSIAAPGVLANDTDADGESLNAILVSGPAHGTVALQASGGFTYTPAAGFSGTDAFTYKASDGTGHSPAAAVSIVIGATPFTVTDTTVADFSAGAPDAQIYLAQTGDGEAILRPAAGSELSGTALEAGWTSGMWNEGGDVTLAGGALTADGAWARTLSTYPAGRSLEFVATFTGAPYQHVGFGQTFETVPWADFSTFAGGGLFARTYTGATSIDTPLSSALLGSPHRFRIDWTATGVTYTVDGTVVATHALAIDAAMRPLMSDFTPNDGALTVDWIRMSPYAATATLLSRVVDAGTMAHWGTLAWTAEVPSGTGLAFSVRRGNTPTPDATWTAFAPIAAPGGTIGGSSRYLQYRVVLTSGDPAATPSIAQVTIGGSRF